MEKNHPLPGTVSILPCSEHLITAVPLTRAAAAGLEGIVFFIGSSIGGSWAYLDGVLGALNHKPCAAALNAASQASGLNRRHLSEILTTGNFLSFVHASIVRASTR